MKGNVALLVNNNIHAAACDKSIGLSLWRPDLDWRADESNGPLIELLPKRLWLLGMGHLGQAYAWRTLSTVAIPATYGIPSRPSGLRQNNRGQPLLRITF